MSPDRYLRTFDVLTLLVGRKDGMRLTEIAQTLGLAGSSVHNMLQSMVAAELLTVSDDLRYAVGPRLVGLALATVSSLDVRTMARPRLQELARAIGDDVYLGMHLGQRVIYVDRCVGTQRISLDIRLGEPLTLHSTATGKLFAALDNRLGQRALAGALKKLTDKTIVDARLLGEEFARIRARGYAVSAQESVEGIVGYAFPIRHADGGLAAAIHVSVIERRATRAHERKLVEAAQACAAALERSLGYRQSA